MYSNNTIGPKSIPKVVELVPNLIELVLNNIGDVGKKSLCTLLSELVYNCRLLMRLKLSNINLNHSEIVNNICVIIETKSNLQYLDLSWGSLSPKLLRQIAYHL